MQQSINRFRTVSLYVVIVYMVTLFIFLQGDESDDYSVRYGDIPQVTVGGFKGIIIVLS